MNGVRLSIRALARNPGYSLIVSSLLALSIGISTAVFSLMDAILLRSLPVAHPDQLVRMVQHFPKLGARSIFPYAYYRALRKHSTTLSAVFAQTEWRPLFHMTDPLPAEATVQAVTPEFFKALGVRAAYGRLLTEGDASNNSPTPAAVLSYRFWRRRFHGDLRALGRTVVINGKHFAVVGITPRDFNGISADTSTDIRVSISVVPLLWSVPIDRMEFELAGRLRPGVKRAGH